MVDIFINMAQDYAESGSNHNYLREIFSVNREVKLSDLNDISNAIPMTKHSVKHTLNCVAEDIVEYGKK